MYTHLGGVLGGYSNKVVLSDRQLDSDRINTITKNKTNDENTPQWKKSPNHKHLRRSKIAMKMLSRLGTRVLPDRRICFAGKLLRGILMPRNHFLQILILKRILFWYSPCLQFRERYYAVSNHCFAQREHAFLKLYLESLKAYWNLFPWGKRSYLV